MSEEFGKQVTKTLQEDPSDAFRKKRIYLPIFEKQVTKTTQGDPSNPLQKETLYLALYYVRNEYLSEVRAAEETQAVLEKLVEQGKAVKQPQIGSGKSLFGYHRLMDFITRFEDDSNYTKYEFKIEW